jgi:CheY-like chemotaxis protein
MPPVKAPVLEAPSNDTDLKNMRVVKRVFKILVAEDSADNRFLIEAILRNQPYALDFVADGESALKKFTLQHYDLVLMDVQMPILDGYEATRRMRVWEQSQGATRTPILALTANALKGDIAQTLAAGCDAHLSKPIHKDVLIAEITKWLLVSPITVAVDTELKALIPDFIKRRQADVRSLREDLSKEDFSALWTTGHILKGVGGSYGFTDITSIGIAIEKAASERDALDVDKQITALQRYLARVVVVFVET